MRWPNQAETQQDARILIILRSVWAVYLIRILPLSVWNDDPSGLVGMHIVSTHLDGKYESFNVLCRTIAGNGDHVIYITLDHVIYNPQSVFFSLKKISYKDGSAESQL